MNRNKYGAQEKVLFKAEGTFDTIITMVERYHPKAVHIITYLVEIESTLANEIRSRFALFFSYRDAWEMFTTVVQALDLKITQIPPDIGERDEL